MSGKLDFAQFARSKRPAPQPVTASVSEAKDIVLVETSAHEPAKHEKEQKPVEFVHDSLNADNDDVDVVSQHKIPISHQIELTGHTKAVSCVSVEPAGNRVVTGSFDYSIKMYDFGGMDSRHRAFRSMESQENHFVVSISHSPSGDRFVVGNGSCQPKLYDRDGKDLLTFVRGDMYLRDLSNTKGHTMEVTGVHWHPSAKDTVLTSSLDGSLRIWDLLGECAFGNLTNKHVLKIRGAVSTVRVGALCCAYAPNASKLLGGASDGTVHIWNDRKAYNRADLVLAHDSCKDSGITGVSVASDNTTVAMRAVNGVILIWNIATSATSKAPIKIIRGALNDYPTANVCFNATGTLLCCGTQPLAVTVPRSVSNDESSSTSSVPEVNKSRLHFYDVRAPSSQPIVNIALEAGATAIAVKWHPTTNQVLCCMSSGNVIVLYDPQYSQKGALLSAHKAPKREKDMSDFATVGEIYYPLALPMYKTEMPFEQRKRKAADAKDAYLHKIPEKPVKQGPGSKENTNFYFTQYVMQNRVVDETRSLDPREALLQEDAGTRQEQKYFGAAYGYQNTQLHTQTFEEEQEEFKKKQKKL